MISEKAYSEYIISLFTKIFKQELDEEGNTLYRCAACLSLALAPTNCHPQAYTTIYTTNISTLYTTMYTLSITIVYVAPEQRPLLTPLPTGLTN